MYAIFNIYNESSQFDFSHREKIKHETDKAFDLITQMAFDMKEQEYQNKQNL